MKLLKIVTILMFFALLTGIMLFAVSQEIENCKDGIVILGPTKTPCCWRANGECE